ncbi:MAG TPA: PIN domain-containing protein [Edaphobacter sp.]|nr:PIN domain-containing protein [Edaphobacter sp.]
MASSRTFLTRVIILTTLSGSIACCAEALPQSGVVRIAEFYRLSSQIDDGIWPEWSKVVSPLLLITQDKEYLTRFPGILEGFIATGDGFVIRNRQFPAQLQTTFTPFGPPSVIAGEPGATASKTTTPWEITLMHEHFHQLQFAQPGYASDLSRDVGLKPADAIHAASALARKCTVLQRFDRHFDKVSHLISVSEPLMLTEAPPLFKGIAPPGVG